jgi:NAD+ synthase
MPKSPLAFDEAAETRRILSFIRRTVRKAGARGVAVGLSGGVDSAVVGALCVKALGSERVVAVQMPSKYTPAADERDAEALVRKWGVRTVRVEISALADELVSSLGCRPGRIAKANVQARIRMTILYCVANSENLLVAGTGDRSEEATGFFTKFGDGGVDFLPIAHLYKTQVRALGAHLGLQRDVFDKPASPQLWSGHTAAEELPADYDKLDIVLYYLFDAKLPAREAASRAGMDPSVVERVLGMHRQTAHKRALPPSLLDH